jgi:hypothetical protein
MDATGRDCHESAGLLEGESPEFMRRYERIVRGSMDVEHMQELADG